MHINATPRARSDEISSANITGTSTPKTDEAAAPRERNTTKICANKDFEIAEDRDLNGHPLKSEVEHGKGLKGSGESHSFVAYIVNLTVLEDERISSKYPRRAESE
ncbi:hypothetical protein PRIPAC_81309 [Pristionchus pacificus]|uniref:Uncharacterized protein n=1 Tax=Pristionchus pacificus TaxID=54126 RepID=A0A2A6C4W8_PRIPA|nr:hypothetical protein PRIPAC_81309 [Pristionchus pacificus]|eukprot:PDM73093.1 hypothetical protein PRIPAC_39527 [Pristionchus pacificus]